MNQESGLYPPLEKNAAANGNVVLAFDQVCFRYGRSPRAVLEHFCLSIPPGSITAVLGPNGAGKTTLLHLATCWLSPQAGRILLDGRPLSSYTRREMGRRVGLVPQSEHIPYDFTLLEYALLGRAPYLKPLGMPGPEDDRIVEHILGQVGLYELRSKPVISMSGGEKQLAMIARAMAQQPALLLLDEPTAHLDIGNKARLARLVKELSAQGMTVVLTTHEPEFAAACATHLVLMRLGQVLETGPLDEVLTTTNLSRLYGKSVEVLEHNHRKVVAWH